MLYKVRMSEIDYTAKDESELKKTRIAGIKYHSNVKTTVHVKKMFKKSK